MAITLAKYKLEGCNWYHFVRIGVLHMTSYLKFWILNFLEWSHTQNSEISKFLIIFFNFAIFHKYSLPKLYLFLGWYEKSFYAPPRCVKVIRKLLAKRFRLSRLKKNSYIIVRKNWKVIQILQSFVSEKCKIQFWWFWFHRNVLF
jgi:hypothetical protein